MSSIPQIPSSDFQVSRFGVFPPRRPSAGPSVRVAEIAIAALAVPAVRRRESLNACSVMTGGVENSGFSLPS